MKKHVLTRLGRFLRPYGLPFLLLLVLLMAGNLLSLAAPLLSGRAMDAVGIRAGGVDFPGVFRNCAGMLGCYALSSLLNYVVSSRLIRTAQAVSHDLRKAAFDHMSELPVDYFDTHPAGDLISRVCYDVDTVNATLSTDLLQLGTSVFTVAGSFLMLLILSPRLTLVFLVTVPLSAALTRFQMKRIHPLFRLRSKELGALNGFAEERMGCRRSIRTYGVEEADLRLFDARNGAASQAYYDADRASAALGPSVNFINNISLTAVSVFGALLYLGGGLSLGSLSSFVLYSRKFSGPIREAANLLAELQASAAAAERVLDLLDEEPEAADPPEALLVKHLEGDIRFDRVTFGYDPARPVLRNFTAHIPAGSLAAVVGPTGAGKTTLVSLLLRFYRPQSGTITVDGIPLDTYSRDGLRRRLALVLQDTWLFGGTIAENIAYGAPGARREQIVEAAKAARIHRFISSLPQGYDTVLTGEVVSKGQKQLLAIARCLLTDADVVILDEATSNVDTETEGEISLAMEQLRQGRTCFVIAHRLATIRGADLILVLDQGGAAESGTHRELLAAGGVYAQLYAAQFQP
ncbi:ABC transporter ATP-binding protein [uncultured Oscillibacter sp.]|uniref:ABC transporter ATP-binding protein n=1 Tax=uncultured Oscillibacter sp. TaxID=876091 RepID=UPI002611DA54|nr:ABC transporter ATP-binding protein [uncultured Oscillibacter sp.]